jgi:hypothetical protein
LKEKTDLKDKIKSINNKLEELKSILNRPSNNTPPPPLINITALLHISVPSFEIINIISNSAEPINKKVKE